MFFHSNNFFSHNLLSTTSLSATPLNANSLERVSMENQECKARSEIINVNTDEPVFYPYSVRTNRCEGIFNYMNNPYVPDIIKNINVKVFKLMSRINETRHIIWHETCNCICR